jgi:hypothetical protein
MMKKGNWIKLRGLTGHGKNRIREHGENWIIEEIRDSRLMLRSKNNTFHVGGKAFPDGRWIDLPSDKNFEIIE